MLRRHPPSYSTSATHRPTRRPASSGRGNLVAFSGSSHAAPCGAAASRLRPPTPAARRPTDRAASCPLPAPSAMDGRGSPARLMRSLAITSEVDQRAEASHYRACPRPGTRRTPLGCPRLPPIQSALEASVTPGRPSRAQRRPVHRREPRGRDDVSRETSPGRQWSCAGASAPGGSFRRPAGEIVRWGRGPGRGRRRVSRPAGGCFTGNVGGRESEAPRKASGALEVRRSGKPTARPGRRRAPST